MTTQECPSQHIANEQTDPTFSQKPMCHIADYIIRAIYVMSKRYLSSSSNYHKNRSYQQNRKTIGV